jgi:hypothetical protein
MLRSSKLRMLIAVAAVAAASAAMALPASAATAQPGANTAPALMAVHGQAAKDTARTQPPPPCAANNVTIVNAPSGDYSIAGDGVNEGVELEAAGNCFTLHNKGTYTGVNGTADYTTYEYQNGDGHCLWQNNGIVEVGSGACVADHPNEEFFGIAYTSGEGWGWGNVARTDQDLVEGDDLCTVDSNVVIQSSNNGCEFWNFPSS